MIQVIVYSIATGRVRRVADPQATVPNVIAFLNQVSIHAGEARIVYNKQGNGADDVNAWQGAVNNVTGKSLAFGQDAGDTYAEIDGANNIVSVHVADPACGDGPVSGVALVLAPAGCSTNWTYDGATFTPPVRVVTK
jgi:hypothetical protein